MNFKPNHTTAAPASFAARLLCWALRVLCLSLAVIFLVWLVWIVLPWFALPPIIAPRVRELGRIANWSRDNTTVATYLAVVLAVFFFRRMFTRDPRRHWMAVAGLAGLAVAYFGLHAWLSRNHLYDAAGNPLFYWGLTPDGTVYKQSVPGLNPYTRRPLSPASSEYITLVESRLREALKPVDPAIADWFDSNTGSPLLWFIRTPEGKLEFYPRPAIHPRYRVELKEVTVELRRTWEKEQQEKRKQEAQNAIEQQQLLQSRRSEAETARLKQETAAARASEEQVKRDALAKAASARREAEVAAQNKAETVERETQERNAVELRHRQAVLDRRAREAALPVIALDQLIPSEMLLLVCPGLNAESFQPKVFEDDYAGRRFRYTGRVLRVDRDNRLATFAPFTVGEIHFVVQATLEPETAKKILPDCDICAAGTVAALRFIPGSTTINGLRGQVCILELGDTVSCPAACPIYDNKKTSEHPPTSDSNIDSVPTDTLQVMVETRVWPPPIVLVRAPARRYYERPLVRVYPVPNSRIISVRRMPVPQTVCPRSSIETRTDYTRGIRQYSLRRHR